MNFSLCKAVGRDSLGDWTSSPLLPRLYCDQVWSNSMNEAMHSPHLWGKLHAKRGFVNLGILRSIFSLSGMLRVSGWCVLLFTSSSFCGYLVLTAACPRGWGPGVLLLCLPRAAHLALLVLISQPLSEHKFLRLAGVRTSWHRGKGMALGCLGLKCCSDSHKWLSIPLGASLSSSVK